MYDPLTNTRRRQRLHYVWRVRGYDDQGEIHYSRMFARRTDAQRWCERELDWYPTVTLERTMVAFQPVEVYRAP